MQMQDLLFQAMSIRDVMGSNSLEPRAWQLYDQFSRPARKGLLGLFSKHHPLLAIPDVDRNYSPGEPVAVTQPVAVGNIVGSLDHRDDLDGDFRPTRHCNQQRWVKVATAMLRGTKLPPVELVMLNKQYYVRDGHLRVSVARAIGVEYLDALVFVVTVNPIPESEQQICPNPTLVRSVAPDFVVPST
jgi:hypothetical protein